MRRFLIRVLHTPLGRVLSDKMFLKIVFNLRMHQRLNLKHPRTYNEKLQWIKLYDRKDEYCRNCDKYEVRKFIVSVLGEEYLVPIVGVYDTVQDIPWDSLPEKFVLKCTHGSGTNIICRDKQTLDIARASEKLNYWMHHYSGFWHGREWSYKNIVPRIVCEEYMAEFEEGIDDYKIMCFNGEPKLIQLHHDRYGDHTLDFYDVSWNKTDIMQVVKNSDKECPPPEHLDMMINIARKLAINTYYVRVDLYNINGRIYFGELTYYPTSGFDLFADNTTDDILGNWIKLPTDNV